MSSELEPNPRRFFRKYYQEEGQIPSGSTDPEVAAYKRQFGRKKVPHTDEQLRLLAEEVRTEMTVARVIGPSPPLAVIPAPTAPAVVPAPVPVEGEGPTPSDGPSDSPKPDRPAPETERPTPEEENPPSPTGAAPPPPPPGGEPAAPAAPGGGAVPHADTLLLDRWERYILGIGFGVYLLAAIGIQGFGMFQGQLGLKPADWIPYTVATVFVGVLLAVIEFGMRALVKQPIDTNTTKLLARLFAFLFAILAVSVIVGVIAYVVRNYALFEPSPNNKVQPEPQPKEEPIGPPPGKIEGTPILGFFNEALPKELFGDIEDDVARPRLWMEALERGSAEILCPRDKKDDKCSTVNLWLLTNEFPNRCNPFTLFVNIDTSANVAIYAFHIRPDAPATVTPLNWAKRPHDPGAVYLFRVPASKKGDRLLIFLGMKETDQKEWLLKSGKITLSSQP
jgi:hypothetical protein